MPKNEMTLDRPHGPRLYVFVVPKKLRKQACNSESLMGRLRWMLRQIFLCSP